MSLALVTFLGAETRADRAVHRLDGRLGLGAQSLREELLVPYSFTGPEFNIGARYGFCRGPHAFDVGIAFGTAPAWTRAKDPALYVHNEIELAYAVRVLSQVSRSLWLGPLVRSSHEFGYLVSWDDAHGYWLDSVMLGAVVRYAEQVLPTKALELSGDVSLLGVASRPPARRLNKIDALNTGEYHFDRLAENPAFAWLGSTSLFRLEALLRWRERERAFGTGLGMGLETRVAIAKEPARYVSWYTGVLFSFAWGWP